MFSAMFAMIDARCYEC